MDSLNFNSVETLPNLSARAAFQVNSSAVFKEDVDIVPVIIDDTLSFMPWGGDNNMPFDILKLIEDDETLSTCKMFNAEVCYGNELVYKYRPSAQVRGYGLENSLTADPLPLTSNCDSDVNKDAQICIGMDYNANINWIVAGQPDGRRLKVSFQRNFFIQLCRN